MKKRLAFIAGLTLFFPLASAAETVSIDPPAEPVVVASPAVDLSLTAEPVTVARGQDVTYTLTISNQGEADFTNLSAQYTLPTGFTMTDGTSPSALKKLGTLAPGASLTKTFTLTVSNTAPTGRVPLELLVAANEFDLNETIAVVDVRGGEVLGAETLVETGTSPIGLLLTGLTVLGAGFLLRRHLSTF